MPIIIPPLITKLYNAMVVPPISAGARSPRDASEEGANANAIKPNMAMNIIARVFKP